MARFIHVSALPRELMVFEGRRYVLSTLLGGGVVLCGQGEDAGRAFNEFFGAFVRGLSGQAQQEVAWPESVCSRVCWGCCWRLAWRQAPGGYH
jgi:hypothetical protein